MTTIDTRTIECPSDLRRVNVWARVVKCAIQAPRAKGIAMQVRLAASTSHMLRNNYRHYNAINIVGRWEMVTLVTKITFSNKLLSPFVSKSPGCMHPLRTSGAPKLQDCWMQGKSLGHQRWRRQRLVHQMKLFINYTWIIIMLLVGSRRYHKLTTYYTVKKRLQVLLWLLTSGW